MKFLHIITHKLQLLINATDGHGYTFFPSLLVLYFFKYQ